MIYSALTDIGLIRESNQDSFFCAHNKYNEFLGVVCDGIGGGKAGDVASQIAVSIIEKEFSKRVPCKNDCENQEWIKQVVHKANEAIYSDSLSSKKKYGMGTTLVGVLITSNKTYVFHLGDSRLYGLYEDEFVCLTEDHNLAADLIRSGEMDESEAMVHPRAKALTNALGIWTQYRVEINIVKENYTHLLLCSDGLYGYVHEDIMKALIKENTSVQNKLKNLIDASNLQGGYDNITAVLFEKGGER